MAQPIFHLDFGPQGLATLTFDLPGRRVNVFTREALEALAATVEALHRRTDISCLIFLSAKEASFCHGVDVELLAGLDDIDQAAAGSRAGQDILLAWERLPFPTVVAIENTCMGGGTELAVASTYRLAADRPDLRIGLPEIRLGILPAWGGCVRLPRLIGLEEALGLILTAKSIPPAKALRLGLVDAVLPAEGFRRHVREFALARLRDPSHRHSDRDLRELLLEKNPLGRRLLLDQARKRTMERSRGRYPAPPRTLEVIRIALEKGAKAGFEAEARALAELATDRVCKNLIHGFRLSQASKRGSDGAKAAAIGRIGVLGSGVIGTGIAHLAAVKGPLPVRIHDADPKALCRSLEQCSTLTRNRQRRGRLSAAEASQVLARLEPSPGLEGFGRVDLVLEAVTEDPAAKVEVLQAVAGQVPTATILATNTSSLSIDELASSIDGPERFVGLHFFNPVHQMPLVEVVAGSRTSDQTLVTTEAFVRRLGKTPLRVRDRPGFLVNRLISSYLVEALWLLEEEHAPEAVDALMVDWGFPAGPFEVIDRIGIDLALAVARRLEEIFPHRLVLPRHDWQRAFLDHEFLGLKSGRGFYRYDDQGRKLGLDSDLTHRLGLAPAHRTPDPVAVADRLILPMVNEAAVCLAEGLVEGPGTVDLAMLLGAGFPPFRGGLCRWADQEGPGTVVQVLGRLAHQVGERFAPTRALTEVASRGGFYDTSSAGV